jgi:hypothetical protein
MVRVRPDREIARAAVPSAAPPFRQGGVEQRIEAERKDRRDLARRRDKPGFAMDQGGDRRDVKAGAGRKIIEPADHFDLRGIKPDFLPCFPQRGCFGRCVRWIDRSARQRHLAGVVQ